MHNVKILGGEANATSVGLKKSLVVAGRTKLFSLTVTNLGAADQWIQIFDSATVPAEGSVPIISLPVQAGNFVGRDWATGRRFGAGICVCNSSTSGTKTIGADDCLIDVQYQNNA